MKWNRKVDRIFDLKKNKDSGSDKAEILEGEYYNPDEDRITPSIGDSLEKTDLLTMIVSAWIMIIPVCLGILLLIVLLAWLMLGL